MTKIKMIQTGRFVEAGFPFGSELRAELLRVESLSKKNPPILQSRQKL